MKIRQATLADIKSVQALGALLSEKEQRDYDTTIDPAWMLSSDAKKYFAKRISKGFAMVAVERDVIVGYCFGSLIEPVFYRFPHKTAELETMFLREECRGKGVGSKMIAEFRRWCKRNKAEVIRVIVSAGNEAGIRFYRRHGFTPVDTTMEINPHNRLLRKKK